MITSINEWKLNEQANTLIRISCASLASIKMDYKYSEYYLLALNKSQLNKGIKILTPIGGALEYEQSASDFLNSLNAQFERKTPDLRFLTSKNNLQTFSNWFDKKIDREVGIDRELIEEMVDEMHVFSSLNANEYNAKYVKTVKESAFMNDIINYRFFEIYQVSFDTMTEKYSEIIKHIESENSLLKLVTKEEILNGKTKEGIEIGNNSKSIL